MPEEPEYEASPSPSDRSAPGSKPLAIGAVLVLILAAVLVYRFTRGPAPAEAPSPAPEASAPPVEPAPSPQPPAPPLNLPPLDASDPVMREHLLPLSSAPEWAALLAGDDVARRFAAAVSTIRQGKSPRRHLGALALEGGFAVRTTNGRLVTAPASFARYDRIAAMIAAIDTAAAASVWRLLHPLAEQAWQELAAPGQGLDAAVARTIDDLLATPQAPADAELVLQEGSYRYVDPSLEGLSPAQKHLLRMGPGNAEKVREALRSLREMLR